MNKHGDIQDIEMYTISPTRSSNVKQPQRVSTSYHHVMNKNVKETGKCKHSWLVKHNPIISLIKLRIMTH